MTEQDYPGFADLWFRANRLFRYEPDTESIQLAFELLSEYPLSVVEKAILLTLKRLKFPPTPSDVIQDIKVVLGIDPATLEAKANFFWNEINKNFSIAYDIITTDRRAVFAFTRCFSSIEKFGGHDPKAEPFDRKDFISAYVTCRDEWLRSPELNLLKGIYHDSQKPKVRFIGDYKDCSVIAEIVYQNRVAELPELPNKQKKALPQKKDDAEKHYATTEELQRILEEFNVSIKPSY